MMNFHIAATYFDIGAGSRGGSCPPENILNKQSRRRPFFYRTLISVTKTRSKSGEELLFLENAYFWKKNAAQIRRRLFFRERLFLG